MDEATGLIQMYRAGFFDCYAGMIEENELKKTPWKKLKKRVDKACKKAFEFRFATQLQGKIKSKKSKNG